MSKASLSDEVNGMRCLSVTVKRGENVLGFGPKIKLGTSVFAALRVQRLHQLMHVYKYYYIQCIEITHIHTHTHTHTHGYTYACVHALLRLSK